MSGHTDARDAAQPAALPGAVLPPAPRAAPPPDRGLATFVALDRETFAHEHWGRAPLLTRAGDAAALVGAAVRSCGPCPDDDSRWAPPSSDPFNEPMIVGVSSSGCSPS